MGLHAAMSGDADTSLSGVIFTIACGLFGWAITQYLTKAAGLRRSSLSPRRRGQKEAEAAVNECCCTPRASSSVQVEMDSAGDTCLRPAWLPPTYIERPRWLPSSLETIPELQFADVEEVQNMGPATPSCTLAEFQAVAGAIADRKLFEIWSSDEEMDAAMRCPCASTPEECHPCAQGLAKVLCTDYGSQPKRGRRKQGKGRMKA
eukprot:TRINITY_DN17832_c0_g1_i5.p1 TRINITY_DN17832_c0_g1~~TRINITY_DN17832_c0_g1_i5.p1  ORF type:complete len:205 (+),score=39.45 TRINITY_DN17832_c0_g1_i5:51-665(+)